MPSSSRKSLTVTLNPQSIPFRSSRLAVPPSPFSPRLPLSPNPARSDRPSTTLIPTHTDGPTDSDLTHHHRLALAKVEAARAAMSSLPSPPTPPLNWIWQCHICSRSYHLAVTRRCLDDGHFFCAGTTTTIVRRGNNKKDRVKVRKHRACGSEFDYRGWKGWGRWRRGVEKTIRDAETAVELKMMKELLEQEGAGKENCMSDEGENYLTASAVSPLFGSMASDLHQGHESHNHTRWFASPATSLASSMSTPLNSPAPVPPLRPARPDEGKKSKNCWSDCDYPSQCRWGNAYGVVSPTTPAFSFTAGGENVEVTTAGQSGDSVQVGKSGSGVVFDKAAAGAGFLPDLHDHAIATGEAGDRDGSLANACLEISSLDRQTVADVIDGVDTSPPASPSSLAFSTSPASLTVGSSASATGEITSPTRATAFAELASLVQSAQRRKSRSEEMGSSPLASQPVDSQEAMPVLTLVHSNVDGGAKHGVETVETEKTPFARALGDFELDFRRGMEKANVLFAGMFGTGKEGHIVDGDGAERERGRARNVKHLTLAGKSKK